MKYLTYGDKTKKSIVLIHGLATTASLCYEKILPFLDFYYVVLVEVDGHIKDDPSPLVSLDDACSDVERYINAELGGKVFCLSGFSMGGTMAVEIAGRGNVKIEKLFIDAAFLTKMGATAKNLYKNIFSQSIELLKTGHELPDFMLDAVMGEDNRAIIEMLYADVSKATINNACEYLYTYSIPEKIRDFKGEAMFIYGQNEPYPRKSAKLLKTFLPNLEIKELKNMGHGQYLVSFPERYTNLLLDFIEVNVMSENSSASSNDENSNSSNGDNKDRFVKMDCEHCGAPLDLDIDNLIAFCPHCGSKLLIGDADVSKLVIEKEQTKRQQKRYEHELEMQKIEKESEKSFWKMSIIITIIFFAIFFALVILGTLMIK